jgi:hypothetical protein
LDDKLDVIEKEEEQIIASGGKLTGSMVGRRRILTTWAVGEAWEVFCKERAQIVRRSFTAVGIALPIDGSRDYEISVKGLDSTTFVEGLKGWRGGGLVDDENDAVELNEKDDENDGLYQLREEQQ